VAAPGIDPHALAKTLNACELPGVRFQPVTYKPFYATFKDQVIGGVQLYFTDPARAPLTAINFFALEALRKQAGLDVFAEASKTNKSFAMFDKVNGTDATRIALQAGKSAAEIVAAWKPVEKAFLEKRKKYLLY
jgi:uncharacterized protein YbbC (DUF1343 family)